MINPHKDLVILRGWPHTKYANREYHFTMDSEDQLLHCKLKATCEMAREWREWRNSIDPMSYRMRRSLPMMEN